jgi:hypothetical protein
MSETSSLTLWAEHGLRLSREHNAVNIYKFHRQRNNYLLIYIELHVSTTTGHPQMPKPNVHIPIFMYIWHIRGYFPIHSAYN